MIQVLRRRTKNNPIMIGEAGVGKTASALIDGAAGHLKMVIDSKPSDLENVDPQSLQLEIERES